MTRKPSIITRASVSITDDARPKIQNDPMYRTGTKMLFDATDDFGANTLHDGAIASGETMLDLGRIPHTVTVASTAISNETGKAGLVSTGGNGYIQIGGAGDCAIPVEHEMLAIFWIKFPAVGYSATPYQPLLYVGPDNPANGNGCQFYADTGADGLTPRLQAGRGASVFIQTPSGGDLTAGPTQLAFSRRPSDGLLRVYLNGAAKTATYLSSGENLLDASAMFARFDTRMIGTIYRMQYIDMTQAAVDEAAMGFNSSEILDAAGHVALDYQFCTGVNAAAPKTAFV